MIDPLNLVSTVLVESQRGPVDLDVLREALGAEEEPLRDALGSALLARWVRYDRRAHGLVVTTSGLQALGRDEQHDDDELARAWAWAGLYIHAYDERRWIEVIQLGIAEDGSRIDIDTAACPTGSSKH